MKLTKSMAKMYQVDVTNLAHLETYEKQGWDVSEFKPAALEKAQAAQRAQEVRAGNLDASEADLANPINLEKLAPYLAAPRDASSALVQEAMGIVLLGKDKKAKQLAEAPLVYGAVVQANHALWKPGSFTASAVVVIALDDAHRNDVAWLNRTAKGISRLKQTADVPADMLELVKCVRVDGGYFVKQIGASVAGGADAWCGVLDIKQKDLPKTFIPSIGVMPFLLERHPKGEVSLHMKLIPAKFYA